MGIKFRKDTRTNLAAATPDDETIILLTDEGNEGLAIGTGSQGGKVIGESGSGDVSKVGTPADGQVGVWTGDGTIEGDAALTFDTTDDSLIIAASGNLKFGAVTVLDDAAGTMTLSNVDALDAATESTIEAAIDTLVNLTSIQGVTVTLADAGADAILGWDDSAGAYENLTQGEAQAVLGITTAAATVLDDATVGDMVNTLGGATSTGTGGLVRASNPTFSGATFSGTLNGGGYEIGRHLSRVVAVTNSTGVTLTSADHAGCIIVTNNTGTITIPTTAGFSCVIVAGGAHTVEFNSTASAAMAAGDLMTLFVESSTVIHAVLTASANKVTFSA
jgi:hypothetical protein